MLRLPFLVLFPFVVTAQSQVFQVTMLPESRVAVTGSSNVNKFTFWYKDTLQVNKAFSARLKTGSFTFDANKIALRVRAFDSGNQLMNGDFLKMMNASVHPYLEVALLAFYPQWNDDSTWTAGEAEISIMINGKSTLLRVGAQRVTRGLFISGSPTVSLSQFELTAPSRMMGLVRVNDEVEVVIILHFSTHG